MHCEMAITQKTLRSRVITQSSFRWEDDLCHGWTRVEEKWWFLLLCRPRSSIRVVYWGELDPIAIMGVQALQDYVESHCAKACQLIEMKDFVKERKASGLEAVLVVDAFSCVRYLYGYNSDWVCGGQWSEMLRNVENFVRSFRQHNIQIVAFLAGEGESSRVYDWIKSQEQNRQTVHKVLNHVNRQANFPPKRLFFLPPAAKMCLRLAFRSCGVSVCCSFTDLHQELVSYCRDGKCCGLIGHDSAYLLLDPPAYLSSEQLTVNKKNLTLKQFDLNVVFNEMCLKTSRLGLFASLLGTPFISEEALAPFHWALIGSEKPASKNQVCYFNSL